MKAFIILSVIGLSILSSCKKDEIIVLSEQEKTDLIFLREEEKLARDVYTFSYNKYKDVVFSNISSSEQSHMNSVKTLLTKYELSDPITNDELGVFSNSELQKLYDELVAKSDSSLTHALEVGATIEDLDINDIKNSLTHTSNEDLIDVYNNLTCGSRNHLRSFSSRLDSYTPSFISQSEYDLIINSSNEQCGN
jgi:hypothetical protein